MWFILCAFLFLISLAALLADTKKPKGFPPGPSWMPIVGCHFEIGALMKKLGFHHLVLEELRKKFGPIVGLRMGRDRIIFISGQSAVKKALVKEEFDARPDGFFFRMRSYNKRLGSWRSQYEIQGAEKESIVFVEGIHFQEQKKFCMTALKKLGMGKKTMENIITKEAEELVKSIRQQCENHNIFQVHNMFDIAVLNSLWALMAGQRFDLNNQKLAHLMDLVHEAFRLLDMSGGVLNQMPFLRFLAPNATGFNKIRFVLRNLENFLERTVDEHKQNLTDEPKDFIDLFLTERNARLSEGRDASFSDQQLIVLLLDLFMAGSETTSNNLAMAMLYMIIYPRVQEKVQKIIDEVIPEDRLPALQDRLRYVEAVLLEVQRHATVVPIAVAHRSIKNVEFEGYEIPKDAIILINLRSVLMDKDRWGDPEIFRPERFLDSSGQIIQDEWFIPFGLGKRRCLGEGLARSSMFLLFSAILQNFRLSGAGLPPLTPRDGVTLSPPPFKAVLKPRFRKGNLTSFSD